MKRKVLALAVVTICLAIIASGTLAYFTAEETAHNVITSGSVGIEIVEKHDDDGDPTTELVDFPAEGVSGMVPGCDVSKIVSVKNNGESTAWIRVWINVGISEPGDPMTNPTIKCLPLTVTDKDGNMVDVISYEVDEDHWFYNDDPETGDYYYYYLEPVKAGETTEILFEKVHFAKEAGNEYQNRRIQIDVIAEAVQYDNNPIPEDGTVADVFYDKNGDPIEILEALDPIWPEEDENEPEGETPDAPTGGEGTEEGGEPTPEQPEGGEAPVEPDQGAEGDTPTAEPEA